jgi:cell division protein FtsN
MFMKKQRGGTFLGLIIGALLGLGAALAVAVYVTKVPVPFMNKSPSRGGAEGDAAEAKKNKDWNPNGPLASKIPVKPPPQPPAAEPLPMPAAPELAAVPVPPAAVVAGAKPAASAPPGKTAKPPPSLDPLGDLAKAKLESPTVLPGVDPFTYFIQAGAFRTPEDAEQQRARLMLLGVQARVSEREQAGRTVYRVRLGPFERKEDADSAKARLDNNSIETALVRVQR